MKLSHKISLWLFFCAFAVFAMAVIGAITRLTESGLSIVEWKPVTGALPPLNAAQWQAEFARYQQSPQYIKVNHGMDLAAFKQIFFWEWLHRLWGRLIGVFYALPLLFFWPRLPRQSRPLFLGVLLLGAAQGAMGWYMVKSGLVDRPDVSHYRLAAHLMLAMLVYACLFRLGLSFSAQPSQDAAKMTGMKPFIRMALVLTGVTMTWGAFTAGLDAGLVYNTFPKMDAHWFPPEALQHAPVWMAFFEEPASVQFTHRCLAITTFLCLIGMWLKARAYHPPRKLRRLFAAVAAMALVQVSLGIATLLNHVEIILATLHQAGAMTVLALLVWLLHEIPTIKESKS